MVIIDGIEVIANKKLYNGVLWSYALSYDYGDYESPDGMLSCKGGYMEVVRHIEIRIVSVRKEGDQFYHEVELELEEDLPDSNIVKAFVEGRQQLKEFTLNGYRYPEDYIEYYTRDSEQGKRLIINRIYREEEDPQQLLDRGESTLEEMVDLLKKYGKTGILYPGFFNLELLRKIYELDPEIIMRLRKLYSKAEQERVFGEVDYSHLALTEETTFEDAVRLIKVRGALDWGDVQALIKHPRAEDLVRLIAEQDATAGTNNGRHISDAEVFKIYIITLAQANPDSPIIRTDRALEALPDGFEGAPNVFDLEIKRGENKNVLPRSVMRLALKFGQRPTQEQIKAIDAKKYSWYFHWIYLADPEQARQALLTADQSYLVGIYSSATSLSLAREVLSAEEYRKIFKEVAISEVKHFLGNVWVENRDRIAELEREFNPEPEVYEEMIRQQVLGDPEHDDVLKLVYPAKCAGIIDRVSRERRVLEASFGDCYYRFWDFSQRITRAELKEILRTDKRIFTKIRCDEVGDHGIKIDNLSKFLFGVPGRHGAIKVETSKRQTTVWIEGKMSRLAEYTLNNILSDSGRFDNDELGLCRVDTLRRRDRLIKEGNK